MVGGDITVARSFQTGHLFFRCLTSFSKLSMGSISTDKILAQYLCSPDMKRNPTEGIDHEAGPAPR